MHGLFRTAMKDVELGGTLVPAGSQLDALEPVLRRLLEEWPQIKAPRLTEILRADYGYTGSLRLVQARLQRLRPSPVRPAQRTGYRPGRVLQLDWARSPDLALTRQACSAERLDRHPASRLSPNSTGSVRSADHSMKLPS